jgi:hypothetical protein
MRLSAPYTFMAMREAIGPGPDGWKRALPWLVAGVLASALFAHELDPARAGARVPNLVAPERPKPPPPSELVYDPSERVPI